MKQIEAPQSEQHGKKARLAKHSVNLQSDQPSQPSAREENVSYS